MREILFIGKRIDNGEWVDGYLINKNGNAFIIQSDSDYWHPVIPETVGQYTGLKDKNGVKIFEGDIVEYHPEANAGIGRVEYLGSGFYVDDESNGLLDDFATMGIEVIGNIHDNPELLEGEE